MTKDLVFEIHRSKIDSSVADDIKLGFEVDAIEATLAKLGSSMEIVKSPHDTDRGRVAILRDPEGHPFELKEAT